MAQKLKAYVAHVADGIDIEEMIDKISELNSCAVVDSDSGEATITFEAHEDDVNAIRKWFGIVSVTEEEADEEWPEAGSNESFV